MDNIRWESWAARAAAHIPFKPDRVPVEEELLAHLEDNAETLMKGGMPCRDAEAQALAAMGDADEVGRALAAVHKPWLGYLWLWSRRVLILCIVVLLFSAFGVAGRLPLVPLEQDSGVAEWYEEKEHYTVTRISPKGRDESDGFTLTVPQAQLVHNETYHIAYESEGKTYTDTVEENYFIHLILEASRWLPMADGFSAFRHFYAVDDQGNRYPGFFEENNENVGKCLVGNYEQSDLWHSRYDAWISELDPEANWVELCYDRDGREVRLRIDLTGGEGT